jgi:hypothetical protein
VVHLEVSLSLLCVGCVVYGFFCVRVLLAIWENVGAPNPDRAQARLGSYGLGRGPTQDG